MTRRFYLTATLVLSFLSVRAEIHVETMETVEFMSALSRLADYPEYCLDNSNYAKEIDTWFKQYKNHETVTYHKKLRSSYVSYSAVASMGVHLYIEDNTLILHSDTKMLEKPWSYVDINEALKKYNKFYKETKFHEFYMAHKEEFDKTVKEYCGRVIPFFHEEWYNSFYGVENNEDYWIIISFNGGGHNYGVSRNTSNNRRNVYNVCTYNSESNPLNVSGTLIHEFNHSFVNPELEKGSNLQNLNNAGNWLLKFSSWAMSNAQAYGAWYGVVEESIVRAAVTIYMLNYNYDKKTIRGDVVNNIASGFSWMPEIVEYLRTYISKRNRYKTLNDFYPEIIKCFNEYIENEQSRIDNCTKVKEGLSISLTNDEFSHSSIDPLLESSTNMNLLKECGDGLYMLSSLDMNSQSYNSWSSVINESIVRAGSIVSMVSKDYSKKKITDAVTDEISKGFTWMPELVESLIYYSCHRDQYPTLNDFYPEIAKCLNSYVDKVLKRVDSCISNSEETSIPQVRMPKIMDDNDIPYYDLKGTRVITPKKGIYIRNGKKIMIK